MILLERMEYNLTRAVIAIKSDKILIVYMAVLFFSFCNKSHKDKAAAIKHMDVTGFMLMAPGIGRIKMPISNCHPASISKAINPVIPVNMAAHFWGK